VRLCATSRELAGSIPDAVTVVNFPWVDSASNRNEYQEYFLGEILKPYGLPRADEDCFALILFLKEGNNVHTVRLPTAKTGQKHTGVT